jgi:hypothetical protein
MRFAVAIRQRIGRLRHHFATIHRLFSRHAYSTCAERTSTANGCNTHADAD